MSSDLILIFFQMLRFQRPHKRCDGIFFCFLIFNFLKFFFHLLEDVSFSLQNYYLSSSQDPSKCLFLLPLCSGEREGSGLRSVQSFTTLLPRPTAAQKSTRLAGPTDGSERDGSHNRQCMMGHISVVFREPRHQEL